MKMKKPKIPPSGRQYERNIENNRNESAQIGESLPKALERIRNSRALATIVRGFTLALKCLMWMDKMERVVRRLGVFWDFITDLLGNL